MPRSAKHLTALACVAAAVIAVVSIAFPSRPTPTAARVDPTPTASPTAAPSQTPAPAPTATPAVKGTDLFSPRSFWRAPIPRGVRFSAAQVRLGRAAVPVNPRVGTELAAFARHPDGSANTWVNLERYSPRTIVVPADQPLVPVKLCRSSDACVPSWARTLDQMMRGVGARGGDVDGGFPVPPDVPLPDDEDTDAAITFYQPGYVGPHGKRGRLYEAWKFRRNPDFDPQRKPGPRNAPYTAAWGGRMVGVRNQGPGHFRDCVTASCGFPSAPRARARAWGRPNSQAESRGWGASASGLPVAISRIGLADCERGRIDHAIGVEVPYVRRGMHWWPAQRGDGWASDKVVTEGMRLSFPRGAQPPASLTPFGRMVWDAAYTHGLVVDDQTASSLNVGAAPECRSTPVWQSSPGPRQNVMRGFPWGDLRVLEVGSDDNPNPTR